MKVAAAHDGADPVCGYDEAERFLQALDRNADIWHFRTLDEKGSGSVRNYAGTVAELWPTLQLDNRNGRGVFVVINAGGQKDADINRIRAVWADFDGPTLPTYLPLAPHIVVEGRPGKYHAYWLVDGWLLDRFQSVQQDFATRFRSDRSTCYVSHVMRLPGFIDNKVAPFRTRIVHIASSRQLNRPLAFPFHYRRRARQNPLIEPCEKAPSGTNLDELFRGEGYTVYVKRRAEAKDAGARDPSRPKPKGWTNLLVVLTGRARSKSRFHVSWNGERFSRSSEAKLLYELETELYSRLLGRLPSIRHIVIKDL